MPGGFGIGLLLLGFAVVWLAELALTTLSPPVDSVEQLTWVRSLQWGYHKHPPLPTWLLWLPVKLLGLSPWTTALTGAAVTLGAMAFFWHLLRQWRGKGYATIALLAALCITFYNGRLDYYNHEVVLLLAVAVCALCCARAFERRSLYWWLALGAALGLGALAKYQIAITVCAVVGVWATQRGWRDPVHRRGLLLALLVASIIFSPHLSWLQTHRFAPVHYAAQSSLAVRMGIAGRTLMAAHWLADQLFNRMLPAWLLLAACIGSRTASVAPVGGHASAAPSEHLARAVLFWWGILPLLFTPAVSLAFGSKLHMHWATPFLPFAVAAAMELRPPAFWNQVRWRCAIRGFVVIQAVLLLIDVARSPIGFGPRSPRSFASQQSAAAIAAPARALLDGPIRVVSGALPEVGALALRLPERPLVLIDGDYRISPWVTPDLVRRCGAVELRREPLTAGVWTPIGAVQPGLYWRVIEPTDPSGSCQP